MGTRQLNLHDLKKRTNPLKSRFISRYVDLHINFSIEILFNINFLSFPFSPINQFVAIFLNQHCLQHKFQFSRKSKHILYCINAFVFGNWLHFDVSKLKKRRRHKNEHLRLECKIYCAIKKNGNWCRWLLKIKHIYFVLNKMCWWHDRNF